MEMLKEIFKFIFCQPQLLTSHMIFSKKMDMPTGKKVPCCITSCMNESVYRDTERKVHNVPDILLGPMKYTGLCGLEH